VLGYTQYRNFEKVIEKAKWACFNSGQPVDDHFADVSKMVPLGSSAQREVADFLLSRYAYYLCIQNSDPSKEIVAVGQTYFAAQTRIREIEEAELEAERRVQLRDEIRQQIRSWQMLLGM
jgi:DNA-damage-inducible protein D